MGYRIHVDSEVNCAFVKSTGDVNFEALSASTDSMIKHPDFRKGMNVLRDGRDQIYSKDMTYKDISEEARRQMDLHDRVLGNCKWAVVVSDGNAYSKVHQFIATGRLGNHTVERKPFRELAQALLWLGIPEDYEIIYPD